MWMRGTSTHRGFHRIIGTGIIGLVLTPPALFAADRPAEIPAPRSNLVEIVGSLFGASASRGSAANLEGATHSQGAEIKVQGRSSGHRLQTFCVNKAGLIFAVVGPSRPYVNVKLEGKDNSAEIHVFDGDGAPLRQWNVDFAVQSIAAAPGGAIFVAGNGMIARFDPDGKLLASAETPHIASLLKNSARLKEEAEAQLEDEKEAYEDRVKQMADQLDARKNLLARQKAALDAKPEAERTAADQRKVRTLELQIRNQETQNKTLLNFYRQRGERTVDQAISEMTGRLKIVNALAVSDQDVFIASGVVKGYGYAIWRTSHDFAGAEQIVSGLSGCCGQMDIRCGDDGVYVAENSRKRVLHFDRTGKKLGQWGESSRNGSEGAGFGGCCNPMNLCFGSGGEVYTAESEGYIKRFTREGSFLGIVGQANVSGGCKNVAIGVSPDGKKAYLYDLQGSRIVVLTQKDAAGNAPPKPAGPDNDASRTPASVSAIEPVKSEFVLTVAFPRDEQGRATAKSPVVSFEKQAVPVADLQTALAKAAKDGTIPRPTRDVVVSIRPDSDIAPADVREVLITCAAAGYKKVTVKTSAGEK